MPQLPLTNSLAQNRTRRGSHKNSHTINSSGSGQPSAQPMALPMASNAAGNLLGQSPAGSGPPAVITNSGSGTPQVSQLQNSSQQGGAAVPTLASHIPSFSAGGPGFPSCLSSGASSGVMSGGSWGCLSSSGTPSQNHNLSGILQSGGSMAASIPHIPGVSSGGPGLPSCLTSGSSSGVTSVGSLGCSTSTGNSLPNHSLTSSLISNALPTSQTNLNLNSYGQRYSNSAPMVLPLLQPMDKSLRPRFDDVMSAHTSTDPLPAIANLLMGYGLETFSLTTASGVLIPDAHMYSNLVDILLAIRSGRSALAGLTPDVQQQLFLMAKIKVKDLDPQTLSNCGAQFTDRVLPSFVTVATTPVASWQSLAPDAIRAFFGILGYPLQRCTRVI